MPHSEGDDQLNGRGAADIHETKFRPLPPLHIGVGLPAE
jgi:hypothetical protein